MAGTEYVVMEMSTPRAGGPTAAGATAPPEAGGATADPVAQFTEKMWKAWDLALHPPVIPVGQTPSDVIYAEGRMRLLRYRPWPGVPRNERAPILLVYALINPEKL